MKAVALTIAGSDPSGGAGIQADLKTFHQHGCYGCSVITLLTVQNTMGVQRVEPLQAELVVQQLRAVLDDLQPTSAKTGALGSAEVVEGVAQEVRHNPLKLIVDPVMWSKNGALLSSRDAVDALVKHLLPYTFLITPNLDEAHYLTGMNVHDPASMREAAKRIADMGPTAVLVKGGHLSSEPLDILYYQGLFYDLVAPRIITPHTHGVGCTLSAAITAQISRGCSLVQAVQRAKRWVNHAIQSATPIGHGICAVDHHVELIGDHGKRNT